jgi:hypothetical protein
MTKRKHDDLGGLASARERKVETKIETTTQPDIVDIIMQAEGEGFETVEEYLIFAKTVVEGGVSTALPGHLGHNARHVYKTHNLADRQWKKATNE